MQQVKLPLEVSCLLMTNISVEKSGTDALRPPVAVYRVSFLLFRPEAPDHHGKLPLVCARCNDLCLIASELLKNPSGSNRSAKISKLSDVR